MAIKRVVSTDFWTDDKVIDMFSPEDKLFMLYLLTNPHANLLGIYRLSPKISAFEIGFSIEVVKVLLDRFETKYKMIAYSSDTQEVAVLNWLKHSVMKGGKPVLDCLNKDLKGVKNKELITKVLKNLQCEENLNVTVREFVETHINQYSNNSLDITNNMDMDMDMDMEIRARIVPRIVDESSKQQIPVDEIIAEYNKICQSLPSVKVKTDKRIKAIKSRWNENGKNIKFFVDYFNSIETSNFLTGRSGKGWKANFDWLMNSSNMAKVLEGNYENEQSSPQASGDIWGNAYDSLGLERG